MKSLSEELVFENAVVWGHVVSEGLIMKLFYAILLYSN